MWRSEATRMGACAAGLRRGRPALPCSTPLRSQERRGRRSSPCRRPRPLPQSPETRAREHGRSWRRLRDGRRHAETVRDSLNGSPLPVASPPFRSRFRPWTTRMRRPPVRSVESASPCPPGPPAGLRRGRTVPRGTRRRRGAKRRRGGRASSKAWGGPLERRVRGRRPPEKASHASLVRPGRRRAPPVCPQPDARGAMAGRRAAVPLDSQRRCARRFPAAEQASHPHWWPLLSVQSPQGGATSRPQTAPS